MTEIVTDLEPLENGTINPQWVEAAFVHSLAASEQDPNGLKVESIIGSVIFDSQKLESIRPGVARALGLLPTEFRAPSQGGGGGWSFLNACNDRNGVQWTGFHRTMDQLFTMAIGLDLASYLMPREMWPVLPGSMPYIGLAELPDEALA